MTEQQWNRAHPVGTAVELLRDEGARERTRTRSRAWTLGSGHVLVLLEGLIGGWLLDRLRPLDEAGGDAERTGA